MALPDGPSEPPMNGRSGLACSMTRPCLLPGRSGGSSGSSQSVVTTTPLLIPCQHNIGGESKPQDPASSPHAGMSFSLDLPPSSSKMGGVGFMKAYHPPLLLRHSIMRTERKLPPRRSPSRSSLPPPPTHHKPAGFSPLSGPFSISSTSGRVVQRPKTQQK